MKTKIILSIILILAPFAVSAHGDDLSGQGTYSMMNMMGGWWGWSGGFFMVSFWVLLILGITALIKWIFKK